MNDICSPGDVSQVRHSCNNWQIFFSYSRINLYIHLLCCSKEPFVLLCVEVDVLLVQVFTVALSSTVYSAYDVKDF